MKCHSRILAPYRACGLVCSEVKPVYEPYTNHPIQGEFCCPIDSVVCIYSVKPFRLHTITDPIDENINAVARFRQFLYITGGQNVYVLKHYKRFKKFRLDAPARFVLPCGEEAFAAVEETNRLVVFDVATEDRIAEVEFPESFKVSAIVHPRGYVNQVLIGSEDGRLRLVDVEKGTLVQEFPTPSQFSAPITVLEQSTADDVVAVGHADGRIQLRHLKLNRVLFSFRHEGGITALSFRADDVDTLVSGSADGSIAIWDLDKKTLVGRKADAHNGPVLSLNFLVGEAFFVTSGQDNRLVKWLLKDETSLPELVKEIEGPSQPVSSVTFTGTHSILFACQDGKVRQYFSFDKPNSLKSLGLAREINKKNIGKNRYVDVHLSPIVEMATVHAREAAWDNVICRHEKSPGVSTWSIRRLTRGSHLLCHERFTKDPRYLACYATSIFLSSCGSFALIGYSSGHFDVFNMQSGRLRNSFAFRNKKDNKTFSKSASVDAPAHNSLVTGVALDFLNRTAVSGAADGYIYCWDFKTGALLSRILNATCGAVSCFNLNRFNSLLAVSFANGDLAVVDVLCRRVARHFQRAHRSETGDPAGITAMTFSADGKWLVSADSCQILKIWDLAANSLVDVMRMELPCKDMCFNETGEFLATAHEGERAIFIWTNLTMFLPDFNVLSLDNSNNNEVKLDLALVIMLCDEDFKFMKSEVCDMPRIGDTNLEREADDDDDEAGLGDTSAGPCTVVVIDNDDDEEMAEDGTLSTVSSGGPNLLTLSGMPPSRWANLAYLDLIRERNKPIEPPKKPESAPFFLSTSETLQGFTFDKVDENGNGDANMEDDTKENGTSQTKAMLMAKRNFDIKPETNWALRLTSACSTEVCDRQGLTVAFNALKAMNISSIDFQIRTLSFGALRPFLEMIALMLERRECFDLVQGYLASFVNAHHETLWQADSSQDRDEERELIKEALKKVLSLQKETWSDVQELVYANTSLTKWIKSALI